MTTSNNNLLLRISKWSAFPENLLTEAFADVLERMAANCPIAASDLVDKLTGAAIHIPTDEWDAVDVSTQIAADSRNYPDLEIRGPGFLCWVEIKDGGQTEPSQLQRYHILLEQQPENTKALVSLTRSTVSPIELPLLQRAVTWSDISSDLRSYVSSGTIQAADPVTRYVVDQFLGYLKGRGMTVERVGFELLGGARELLHLQSMLRDVLEGVSGVTASRSASTDRLALYVPDQKGAYGFVVATYLANPEWVSFEAPVKDIRPAIETLNDWDSFQDDWIRKELNLGTEEAHFFSRSVSSQAALIKEFLESCLGQVGHVFGKRAGVE